MEQKSIMDELQERLVGERHKRIALVVQGGGMRGIYSLGALAALESAGLTNAFDIVVGSSAGAINGAYLLAGQANQAISAYIDDLSNRQFVNPLRVHKMVNIDFMVDEVLKNRYPLNTEALFASPILLEVVLTDAETAEPVVVTNRDTDLDFYEVLRATSALPALYNRRVRVRDRDYVDGGTVDGVPVIRAVEASADAILAVVTRRPGFRRRASNMGVRLLARSMARGQSVALRDRIGREDVRFNEAMDLLEGIGQLPTGLRRRSVWPSDENKLVGRTTSDRARLRECADMGRADMQAVLKLPWEEQ
ncbi:MAG: patatin-like phospholipase family protein [Pseudonocardiaceae bacterium]